ncbi:restriction endonuclease subunit S [Staphylococcus epidermidis]|uniref:Type I restriction-modification system, S subunit, EcoA family n=2 Tax=Staphylococcus epidermidis TaxID=1282 RepID=Q5HK79_STAEQ|nr:restriction endonuclease subunit S [Staphylococcus epidermidis]AAW53348.1 type I restriction-modification system, S subunit, EcoA family [Staphylococcus epidermidis RP62A]EHR92357.1 type I restriction modification DNA specificity domain protein [Staphylococcus epidermidis VCU126]MCG1531868.1 restriction endonuclease subunit S [Staphylococcus epidermidis]MCG1681801.1 restriction endonuclease subunit S [Staphylococcus epidermidis]MCG1758515.1 restriction endonuclease subunit S [Staphylococcus
MTEHTNTPELRFPEFREEWNIEQVSDFLIESKIVGHKGNQAKKLTVKLWGKGIVEKESIFKGSSNTQYYIRKAGQLMYGKLDFLNCAFGLVPTELNNFESTIDSPSFDFIKGDKKFLLERIKMKSFYKKYGDLANGSRKAKRINQNTFLSMPLYAPTINEQKKIGDFFSKLDRQIELEEKKLELLEQQKRGYMQKIFSQQLRFKDEKGNDYPKWIFKKFEEIFKVVPSKKYQIKSSEIEDNASIPVIDQGQNLILGFSNNKEKVFNDFKNVIIYGDHTTVIKRSDKPFIIGGDGVKLLTSKVDSDISYLYNALQYFNVKSEGYKRHFSILKNKDFYISTSIEEQKRIANIFNKLDKYIEKQFAKVELLKQRKQGLLQKMFV